MHDFHKRIARVLWDILATLFILWGLFALATPLTPGSWLAIAGLIIIFGRRKTETRTQRIMGRRLFTKLRMPSIFRRFKKF